MPDDSTAAEITAAAVQMDAATGVADATIEQAEQLAREALEDGANVVGLPEFFTSRIYVDDVVWDAVLPPGNRAEQMLRDLATEYDATVNTDSVQSER